MAHTDRRKPLFWRLGEQADGFARQVLFYDLLKQLCILGAHVFSLSQGHDTAVFGPASSIGRARTVRGGGARDHQTARNKTNTSTTEPQPTPPMMQPSCKRLGRSSTELMPLVFSVYQRQCTLAPRRRATGLRDSVSRRCGSDSNRRVTDLQSAA